MVLKISCLNFFISLYTDNSLVYDYFLNKRNIEGQKPMNLHGDYPCIKISPQDDVCLTNNYMAYYANSRVEYFSFDVSHNAVHISKHIDDVFLPDITYLIVSILMRVLNENMLFCVHSAVIEKDGQATVLIGDVGAGKTSVASILCMNYGFDLISNDHSIIGIKNEEIEKKVGFIINAMSFFINQKNKSAIVFQNLFSLKIIKCI